MLWCEFHFEYSFVSIQIQMNACDDRFYLQTHSMGNEYWCVLSYVWGYACSRRSFEFTVSSRFSYQNLALTFDECYCPICIPFIELTAVRCVKIVDYRKVYMKCTCASKNYSQLQTMGHEMAESLVGTSLRLLWKHNGAHAAVVQYRCNSDENKKNASNAREARTGHMICLSHSNWSDSAYNVRHNETLKTGYRSRNLICNL